ncbi:protein O-mannosyl-transferase TMTC3-like isoform X2 [Haliotis cracherodii]|uniref:protein O-mannosyl-transferase TMTC3-like isoform X2 n=1 Tax=Haliotis cracherodii TaxID=6455 RepID=UPI0039EA500C
METFTLYSAVLLGVVSVCYFNSLNCGFVFDDMSAVVENKDLRPHTSVSRLFWNDFWGTPMQNERSHKSYRPLCVLTFRLNYSLSELEPMTYHLVNTLLHAVVCIMFMKMCCMFLKEWTSFLAALLFAVHPVHTEAVTGVVGRAEALSSIFILAALMTYVRCTGYRKQINWIWLITTVWLVTIAMLCKEQGITVIGICCVYEVFVAQRASFWELVDFLHSLVGARPRVPGWLSTSVVRMVFLVGSTLLMLFARIKVMGAQLPVFTRFDNPASVADFPARHLTFNYLLSVNSWLLLNPSHLCCDWTMGTIPLLETITDYRNIFTLIFYAMMIKFVTYALSGQSQRSRCIIMSLAFLVLPFVPASNLFFPVGFVVAERILYTPSMGFCMLVALGFQILVHHKQSLKMVVQLLMAGLLLTHSIKTVLRNNDWASEYTLFKSGLKVNQENAKLFNNVGHALEKVEKYSEALEYFETAVSVQPDDIGAHINVGRTLSTLNRTQEAEKAYRSALALFPPVIPGKSYTTRIAPNHLNVYLNLASLVSKNPDRLQEADDLLRTAVSMRSDYIQGYINRGDVLVKLGKREEAKQVYQQALKVDDDNADIYYNLGVVSLELKQIGEARRYFEAALVRNPDHTQTLFNSAILLQEGGNARDRPESYRRLKKLLDADPEDSKIHFNLAMLAMDDKDFIAAEKYFKRALEIRENFPSALFNMALMLVNDMNRPGDALLYLRTLLQYKSDHIKGLILTGDLNVNYVKDLNAAQQNFEAVLALDPKHVQGNHNLCVVYVEQGDLLKAEKCLVHAHNLAPEEDYIKQHLNIVRRKIQQIRQQMAAQKAQAAADKQPSPQSNQQAAQGRQSAGAADKQPSPQSNQQAAQGRQSAGAAGAADKQPSPQSNQQAAQGRQSAGAADKQPSPQSNQQAAQGGQSAGAADKQPSPQSNQQAAQGRQSAGAAGAAGAADKQPSPQSNQQAAQGRQSAGAAGAAGAADKQPSPQSNQQAAQGRQSAGAADKQPSPQSNQQAAQGGQSAGAADKQPSPQSNQQAAQGRQSAGAAGAADKQPSPQQ